MNLEIEKKFKVTEKKFKSLAKPLFCKQGYLNINNYDPTIRIRIINNSAYLTIKSKNIGITRLEYEYKIPLDDANQLLSKYCKNNIIKKNRYIIKLKGTKWEIDEFLDKNLGLIIAEVELSSENDTFYQPNWIGKEISHNKKYYNINLIKFPYSKWGNKT